MRRNLDRDDGVTLPEVLVTSILTMVVLAVVATMMVTLMTTPRMVTDRLTAAGNAQVASRSIDTGIRNSSDFRLTSPNGTDQLLVARTAQPGATITWVCSAWYYSASDSTMRYTVSPTAIPLAPTRNDLAGWTVLASAITPISGSTVFSVSGEKLTAAFTSTTTVSGAPQTMITSAFSRAGSTGSPVCY